jgi:hypothetical protein
LSQVCLLACSFFPYMRTFISTGTGPQVMFVRGLASATQTLSVTLSTARRYTFSFHAAYRKDNLPNGNPQPTPTGEVALRSGTSNTLLVNTVISPGVLAPGVMRLFSVSFVPPASVAGEALQIRIATTQAAGQINYDLLRLKVTEL